MCTLHVHWMNECTSISKEGRCEGVTIEGEAQRGARMQDQEVSISAESLERRVVGNVGIEGHRHK